MKGHGHKGLGERKGVMMRVAALGLLLLGAAPMLARAWQLNLSEPEDEGGIRWLMGASICIALASALLQ